MTFVESALRHFCTYWSLLFLVTLQRWDWSNRRADHYGDGHVFNGGQPTRLPAGHSATDARPASHADTNLCKFRLKT